MTIDETIRTIVREEVRAAFAASTPTTATESTGPDAEYIDDKALALWLGVSRALLKQMRPLGKGPPHVRVARRAIRYHVPTVRKWLEGQARGRLGKRSGEES